MKRPHRWLRLAVLIGLLLVVGEYAALTWLAPRHVVRAVQKLLGGELTVERVRLSVLLKTSLSGLRLVSNIPESAFSIQQVTMRPRWISFPRRTLWIDALEFHQPTLRLTRTAAGTLVWPSPAAASRTAAHRRANGWRVYVRSVTVTDGAIEWIDDQPSSPVRVLVDHLSLNAGPLAVPFRAGRGGVSVAVQGRVSGSGGQAAPFHGSGWMDPAAQDLQASWELQPLALAMLEPYLQGKALVRVYESTLRSTSQWVAKADELLARIQLEVQNLREGDISILGRTVVDARQLTGGQPDVPVKGEVQLTGPLTDPNQWQANFSTQDQGVQDLIARLLEHNIKVLKLGSFGPRARVSLAPLAGADVQEVSKDIQDALELLAGEVPPPPGEAPAPAVATGARPGDTEGRAGGPGLAPVAAPSAPSASEETEPSAPPAEPAAAAEVPPIPAESQPLAPPPPEPPSAITPPEPAVSPAPPPSQ